MRRDFFDLARKAEPVNFTAFFGLWFLGGLAALAVNAGIFIGACYIVKWIFF